MDPLRLLSRATKTSRSSVQEKIEGVPSSGQNAPPQLFPHYEDTRSRKRKRGQDSLTSIGHDTQDLNFFSAKDGIRQAEKPQNTSPDGTQEQSQKSCSSENNDDAHDVQISLGERKHIFKQHKLKMTWLNPPSHRKHDMRKKKGADQRDSKRVLLFSCPVQSFKELKSRHGVSRRLAENVINQGFDVPTEVQLAALPLLLDQSLQHVIDSGDVTPGPESEHPKGIDMLAIAPTGSGKTLAYLIPLLQAVLNRRRTAASKGRNTSAIVLAPTKELAGQIVNEGRKLCKGTGVKITKLRKGMKFTGTSTDENKDDMEADETKISVTKADVVVSTPGLLHSMLDASNSAALSDVQYLVLDEGDVLLDPLFREQTLSIWDFLSNPELRISMWSATMGSNIEELVAMNIDERRKRLATELATEIDQIPLIRLVVGLKDSAIPHVKHKLIYAATEQGKLMGLRQLLRPTSSSVDSGPPLIPPFLVFTQTIDRAVALHSELLYDIPAEAGGISRIAVLHADLSDTARDSVMTKFREGEIWVLVTTDLLSRGVDFRGVNGVVNYDIPTSSAAYVHRVGRTGRAGREGGVAVTLYSKEDIPYLKHVVNVVTAAEKQRDGDHGPQQWLKDVLPRLGNNEKQKFKKHGVEAKTATGRQKDPKAARKARISSKAGYVRRSENNRKGAMRGSGKGLQNEVLSDGGDETDFGGFD